MSFMEGKNKVKFPEAFKYGFENAKAGDRFRHVDGNEYLLTLTNVGWYLTNVKSGETYNASAMVKSQVACGNDKTF